MANRTIIVASTLSNKSKKFTTNVKTLGELKALAPELFTGDVDVIVKPGNVTLNGNDSTLPTGDSKVYVVPSKNKAGVISVDAARTLGREIAEAIVEAAQKASAEDVNSLKETLVEDIENFFGIELGGADCPECEEVLEEAKAVASGRRG